MPAAAAQLVEAEDAPRDTAIALLDSIVANAFKVEHWLRETLADAAEPIAGVPVVSYELWLPVARVDAVAQSLAMLDKSWRLAATLVDAADRGSRPEWPLEDLLANPSAASLCLIEADTGSFSSALRASLRSARQSPAKTAVTAGQLLGIPGAIAASLALIVPGKAPEPCPHPMRAPPAAAQHDVGRLLGRPPAGIVITQTIDYGDGRKATISPKGHRRK